MNPTNSNVKLESGQPIACIYDILSSNVDICSMEQMDDNVSVNSINTEHSMADLKKQAKVATDIGITLPDSTLTSQQQLELLACVGRKRDVFACNLSELSTTDLSEHKIDTRYATPIRQRFYRTSSTIKREIEKQCEEMLKNNIIEQAPACEWQSPVVMVKKKSGEYRFAVDYRKVNSVTVPHSFPLPRLDDVFDALGDAQARLYSSIDLFNGFWQVPVAEESRNSTGFVTHHGVWGFKKIRSMCFSTWVCSTSIERSSFHSRYIETLKQYSFHWWPMSDTLCKELVS